MVSLGTGVRRLARAALVVGGLMGGMAGTAAAEEAAPDTYLLRYHFEPGETLRWKVLHLGTTDTTVRGVTQVSRCRTLSLKVWTVTDVTEDAEATFTHQIAWVDASNKVSDRAEVRYDSRKDAIPPEEFAPLATTIGRTLTTATVTPRGQIRDRDSQTGSFDMGLGEILVPFPEEAIAIGSSWHVPDEIRVTKPDKTVERVKIRKTFTLRGVTDAVAELTIRTEVLTPLHEPQVKVQLLQKIPHGTIRFDMTRGQVVSRQMDWSESVVGFDGRDGAMEYLARFTEELVPDETGSLEEALPPDSAAPATPATAKAVPAGPVYGPQLPKATRAAALDPLAAPVAPAPR